MNTPITIAKPCHENWDLMPVKTVGRYCGSCEKTVRDFTRMSDEELIAFMRKKSVNECGRFREDQVLLTKKTPFTNFKLKMAASFALIFARFLFPSEAKAQDTDNSETTKGNIAEKKLFGDSVVYHVTGKLIGRKTNEGLRYAVVKVEVNGKPVGGSTYTNDDGKFELNVAVKNSADVISLNFEKRHYKTHKVENYTPDGKEMNIKLRQTRKQRYQSEHYVMGRYLY